ncbi:MAG: class II aldolase/adducin family protein [Proteobacteria bacterium]|nr:class II aldolase/adducin family protein [Pseudomonadota bacterium]
MQISDPRFRVAAARRILYRGGCDSLVAGHVSARAEGGDSFWMSPFEYFDETTPERIVRLGLDLEPLEGSWEASPAAQFHAALYAARPDVGSVIHTHSHWLSVFVTRRERIGMYNAGSVLFYADQVLHEDDGSGPAVEGETLARKLGDKHVILIKNHGAIVVAETLEVATIKALMLEQAARYHLEAERWGGSEFPEAEVLRGRKAYEKHFLPQMWQANLRRLRRSDPDLFESLDD